MEASKKKVFYYHADACPIGGLFTHPVEAIVPGHGSSSLPQAGGYSAARVNGYRLDSLISFDHAYSEIYGMENKANDSWATQVTSVVEGLNIFETIQADRVVATLSVEHSRDAAFQPTVSIVGSQFENLRIAGVRVNPVFSKDLITHYEKGTFPRVALVDDREFVAKAVDQNAKILRADGSPEWLKERYGWIQSQESRKQKGYVLCSLVKEVQGAKPGSSYGHVLHVPDFGNIFLSELLVDQHTYRLTMIRMEMGCAAEGRLSVGTADSNGSPMP
jgi:hypothetical protein